MKHFPPIRVWGTVGFIAAMWFVDLTHIGGVQIKLTEWQLYVSALLSFVLAAYSFSLPGCPVGRSAQKQSWVDTLGLRACLLYTSGPVVDRGFVVGEARVGFTVFQVQMCIRDSAYPAKMNHESGQ